MWKALEELTTDQRMAVTLGRFEDMSNEEIADVMGVGVGAVKSLLHRAQIKLREKLSDYV